MPSRKTQKPDRRDPGISPAPCWWFFRLDSPYGERALPNRYRQYADPAPGATYITGPIVLAIEEALDMGIEHEAIAGQVCVTPYVVGLVELDRQKTPERPKGLFVLADKCRHTGNLAAGSPYRGKAQLDAGLDEVGLRRPRRCAGCGAMIRVIPCRACRLRCVALGRRGKLD
jgi:hypothetical protein